jgi:hypothetical protein
VRACSYQDLVLSAMVDKGLGVESLVAIVNNNLIAYDRSRDLAGAIGDALRAARAASSSGEDGGARGRRTVGEDDELEDGGELDKPGADSMMTQEIEDVCRCALPCLSKPAVHCRAVSCPRTQCFHAITPTKPMGVADLHSAVRFDCQKI